MDLRFEVAVIPVSDVDRARAFYEKLGWRLDADATTGDSFRIVQFTPPGSVCSVQFGTNMTAAAPGGHEERIGAADPDWPGWYAAYMVAEQNGTEQPT